MLSINAGIHGCKARKLENIKEFKTMKPGETFKMNGNWIILTTEEKCLPKDWNIHYTTKRGGYIYYSDSNSNLIHPRDIHGTIRKYTIQGPTQPSGLTEATRASGSRRSTTSGSLPSTPGNIPGPTVEELIAGNDAEALRIRILDLQGGRRGGGVTPLPLSKEIQEQLDKLINRYDTLTRTPRAVTVPGGEVPAAQEPATPGVTPGVTPAGTLAQVAQEPAAATPAGTPAQVPAAQEPVTPQSEPESPWSQAQQAQDMQVIKEVTNDPMFGTEIVKKYLRLDAENQTAFIELLKIITLIKSKGLNIPIDELEPGKTNTATPFWQQILLDQNVIDLMKPNNPSYAKIKNAEIEFSKIRTLPKKAYSLGFTGLNFTDKQTKLGFLYQFVLKPDGQVDKDFIKALIGDENPVSGIQSIKALLADVLGKITGATFGVNLLLGTRIGGKTRRLKRAKKGLRSRKHRVSL